MTVINNAELLPEYTPFSEMKLEKADETGELLTPDWLKSAIIAEVRLDTASTDGTLKGLIPMLEHYREMGVNCLWVTPVNEMGTSMGKNTNGYTNNGIHTIDCRLTGTTDYTEGWNRFGEFVNEAHKRDIRILLDVTIWGVDKEAPVLKEHPEYFKHNENGEFEFSSWSGPKYDYKGENFRNWYKENILRILDVTDIDGYRLDLEPGVTGYDFWADIRKCAYENGKKIVLMTEYRNERNGVFDFEEIGVIDMVNHDYWDPNWFKGRGFTDDSDSAVVYVLCPVSFWLSGKKGRDIVTTVKNGSFMTGKDINYNKSRQMQKDLQTGNDRFYTYMLSCHDSPYTLEPDVIRFGYQAIFAPVIPVWMMGDETGNVLEDRGNCLYYKAELSTEVTSEHPNFAFYEDVKKMIRIRRENADVFEYFPLDHRMTNICKVETIGLNSYQAYARYNDEKAFLIIPNGTEKQAEITVDLPCKLQNFDVITAKELMRDIPLKISDNKIRFTVKGNDLSVLYLRKNGKEEMK